LTRGFAFTIPDGWAARGWRFEVETTVPQQRSIIRQHFGARRFAYNWALAAVKANLDERTADPSIPPMDWTLPTLRKAALQRWVASRDGHREGQRVGFPQFRARHRDHGRVRFSSCAMRLESDRRHLTLPVIGRLRSKESTWCLERKLIRAQARVLSMTLSERGNRLFISVATIIALEPNRRPRELQAGCGIDLGVGTEWAVIAHADDSIEQIAHPAPWSSVQQQRSRLARCLARRTVGSRGHRTVGSPPPGPPPGLITAAVATALISDSPTAGGFVLVVAAWWTATPTPLVTSVTGPDPPSTGMSSGVELPPRCRSWATTAGRLRLRLGMRGLRRPPRGGGGL
jgi:putative transposase